MENDTIRPLPDLEFSNEEFAWKNKKYKFKDVSSLIFSATVTSNSINGIPTGKTYAANLTVELGPKHKITVTGATRTFKSGISKESFHGIQVAHAILSQATLSTRLKPMENDLMERGFFQLQDFQITASGSVFKNGVLVAELKEDGVQVLKEPFAIVIRKKPKGMKEKLLELVASKDVTIDLSRDQDCFLYMLNKATGLHWIDAPPPKKPIDRRELFYRTVLRFGARLAMSDGSADASELLQLKRFFDIGPETLPDAASVFNKALRDGSSLSDILSEFREEFKEAKEVLESFLVGMCTVALADGRLDSAETLELRQAASFLRLDKGALNRAFAAVGFDFENSTDGNKQHERAKSQSNAKAGDLKVLGLDHGATQLEIRQAYIDLVKRYHPDKLIGQGLPQNEIAKAEAIIKGVNIAYERLKD